MTQSARYPLDHIAAAEADFIAATPDYAATALIDDLRRTDYARLDAGGHVYLDYTGGSLYAQSQLDAHHKLLAENVFGNPHSFNPTSQHMTELVEAARAYVLKYFNADPDEYACIFTQNATGALKLVGEAYPFESGARYLPLYDNHNSVNGIREYAHHAGAEVTYVPVLPPDLRIDAERLALELAHRDPSRHNLFAFPAQSNFSGVQHDLGWIDKAHAHGWDVLLDAAAFVPTNRLDLRATRPDFIALSFYKMFGYPTGIGALLARREKLAVLRRPWYAGGTLVYSTVQGEHYYLAPGETGFEDGTLNYLGIPAVEIGLKHVESIGIPTIHARVECLTAWLLKEMTALKHSNGAPVVKIYGPTSAEARGGTIQFNFFGPRGTMMDGYTIEKMANQLHTSVRTGCHCNPGAREMALGISEEELAPLFKDKDRMTYQDFLVVVDGKKTGAMRVSLGIASNFADAYRFMHFAESFVDHTAREVSEFKVDLEIVYHP
ncbi:MAG: aminotransferase class V-fold PLP-dependent enzyme [Chloroflexi bacterium]|nr:aminotransferase class V-fold PLP-dependent enzyme [Chloroflexota bacterium]